MFCLTLYVSCPVTDLALIKVNNVSSKSNIPFAIWGGGWNDPLLAYKDILKQQ